jgi:hypothetical protein
VYPNPAKAENIENIVEKRVDIFFFLLFIFKNKIKKIQIKYLHREKIIECILALYFCLIDVILNNFGVYAYLL